MKNRLFLVLMALLAFTLAGWSLMGFSSVSGKPLGAILLVLAFVKVHLIVVHYMEANSAEPFLRNAFKAWTWLVGALVIGMYLG